jgi:phage shock protein A
MILGGGAVRAPDNGSEEAMASIFKRIGDVLSANVNDLIDRVEDPERMVKQVIREIEDSVAEARSAVVEAVASEKRLQKELELARRESADWLEKAEEALQAGDEDLARKALETKKGHDRAVKRLEPSWDSARQASEALKGQLRILEQKLEEARQKQAALVSRQRVAEARDRMGKSMDRFQAGIAATENFARMESRVATMEARAEAASEVLGGAASVDRDIQKAQIAHEVENELTALKKKLAGQPVA